MNTQRGIGSIAVIAFVALLALAVGGYMLFGTSSEEVASDTYTPKERTTEVAEKSDSKYETFVAIEAEVACALAKAAQNEDPTALMGAMGLYAELAQENGFSESEVETMIAEYKKDATFQTDVLSKMELDCPNELSQMKTQ